MKELEKVFRKLARAIFANSETDNAQLMSVIQLAKEYEYNNGSLSGKEAMKLTAKLPFITQLDRLMVIDKLLGHHGLEAFQSADGYYEYSNSGDSYAETVLLTPHNKLIVNNWGDIVESPKHARWEKKYGINCY